MNMYSPDLLEFLKVINAGNYRILDTETTGLNDGEICQIAIINADGHVLLDRLVKPKELIPPSASQIHGITNEMVGDADTWEETRYEVIAAIADYPVIIYNAVYDRRMMHQSDDAWGLGKVDYKELTDFHCAMLAYAEFWGEWNEYRQSFKWQSLTKAAEQQHIIVRDAHHALGDCLMTMNLVNVMKIKARKSPRHPDNVDPQDEGLST